MKQVKVNEDLFDALLTVAEQAIANDAVDKATIDALNAANENEEELAGDRKARVDALVPPAPAPEPAPEVPAA